VLGKNSHDGKHLHATLAIRELLFRIRTHIELILNGVAIVFHFCALSSPGVPLFYAQIMSYAKKPSGKVVAGFAELEMPIERQEGFLNDVFAFFGADSQTPGVAQQPGTILIEEHQYLLLDRYRRWGTQRIGSCQERGAHYEISCCRHEPGSVSGGILHFPEEVLVSFWRPKPVIANKV
jgi:hypothetical protein